MIARIACLAVLLGGCQSTEVVKPAVFKQADIETMARLKTTLAAAMKKGRVEIGPGDLTKSSQIAVLPPRLSPYEGLSPALPTYFDLAIQNGKCVVIRRNTGEIFEAPYASCRAVDE